MSITDYHRLPLLTTDYHVGLSWESNLRADLEAVEEEEEDFPALALGLRRARVPVSVRNLMSADEH
jgi:hypothetical protein